MILPTHSGVVTTFYIGRCRTVFLGKKEQTIRVPPVSRGEGDRFENECFVFHTETKKNHTKDEGQGGENQNIPFNSFRVCNRVDSRRSSLSLSLQEPTALAARRLSDESQQESAHVWPAVQSATLPLLRDQCS